MFIFNKHTNPLWNTYKASHIYLTVMKPSQSEQQDFLDAIADFEPKNASEKLCKKIYNFMQDNKDALQLQKSTIPYFVVSNDLVQKYVGFMKLCVDAKTYPKSDFINEISTLMMQSYEPGELSAGLYHSKPTSFILPLVDVWLSAQ